MTTTTAITAERVAAIVDQLNAWADEHDDCDEVCAEHHDIWGDCILNIAEYDSDQTDAAEAALEIRCTDGEFALTDGTQLHTDLSQPADRTYFSTDAA